MDSCIEWTGYTNKTGYGTSHGKLVHRVAYEKEVGPIPDGMELDHLCFNRVCINTSHLEPVTHQENMKRSVENQTHCKNGHEFNSDNTHIVTKPSGYKFRQCRACNRVAAAKYREKRKTP